MTSTTSATSRAKRSARRRPKLPEPSAPRSSRRGRAPLRLALLGDGALARWLAPQLARAGLDVRRWKRGQALAPALVHRELVLIAVSDRSIAALAREIAREIARSLPVAGQGEAPRVALHTSGYHSAEVLEPLTRRGLACGSFHPLASVTRARARSAAPLRLVCLGGARSARSAGRALASALGAAALELNGGAEQHARYHAASALLANGAVALFDAALEGLRGAGLRASDARRAALALLTSAAARLELLEPEQALSGPIARGEEALVRGHERALRSSPELLALYRALARRQRAIAARRTS